MTSICFITPSGRPLARWREAFPDLITRSGVEVCTTANGAADTLYWLDLAACPAAEIQQCVAKLVSVGGTVVCLAVQPSDQEAYQCMAAGARGYCHVESVPEQLREVATVVASGGYWMPAGLVQRLLRTAVDQRVVVNPTEADSLQSLTHREYAVAERVGKGLSNREIADELDITERTVKAHLTAIFEKLDVRDRVQLALVVNRLPIH